MRTKYPDYNKALRYYIDGNIRYFNRTRKSPNMSFAEKNLLEVRSLFLQKDWSGAWELLNSFNPSCPFLKGDQFFLKAYSKSHIGDFAASAGFQEQAIACYEEASDRRGQFLAHYNSSVAYNRLGNFKQEESHLKQAFELASWPSETILILRGQACLFSSRGDYDRACHFLDQALNLDLGEKDINENDKLNLLSVAVDIYFRSNQLNKAIEILEELKLSKINSCKARVAFEHYLLKCYLTTEKLGRMPLAIKNTKEYVYKWELIKAVQTGQINKAKKFWDQLAQLFPDIYGPAFELINKSFEKTIFFTYLTEQFKTESLNIEELKKLQGKNLKKLYKILVESPVPLSKENLIEKIWETEYSPDFDNRFYQLMKRLKQRVESEVVNTHNCYKINVKKSA